MFVTAARFTRKSFEQDEAVRQRAQGVKEHLTGLALDLGLDPEENIKMDEAENEIRIGVSEDFDIYLREAPGEWRNY